MILMSKSANVHVNKNFDLWTSYHRFIYFYCFYSCGSNILLALTPRDQNTFIIKKLYVKDLKNFEMTETSRRNSSRLLRQGTTPDWKVSHWNEISLKKAALRKKRKPFRKSSLLFLKRRTKLNGIGNTKNLQ